MTKPIPINRDICIAQIPNQNGLYGYDPSLAAGIVFCVLFGLSTVGHIFTSFRYRTWWQFVFATGALGEVLGWAGRSWSHHCPYQSKPYLLQATTLVLAPTFITAGIYIILGRLINSIGREVSPLSASSYLYIFCSVDTISLVIQAAGGGMAAVAYQKNPPADADTGTHVMVAGILFQLVSILVFITLFTIVILRALKNRATILAQLRVQSVIAATLLSVTLVVVRSIYRTIELLQGWSGYLITTERYFIALDGTMMLLAVGVFNIVRPGWANATEIPTGVEREPVESQVESQVDTSNK